MDFVVSVRTNIRLLLPFGQGLAGKNGTLFTHIGGGVEKKKQETSVKEHGR